MLKLSYCGDDCNLCPRYIAAQSNSIEKLKEVAALWKKAGWRESIVPPEEMACNGCRTVKWCRYDDIRKCAKEKRIDNCGLCRDYPCKKIEKFSIRPKLNPEVFQAFIRFNYYFIHYMFLKKYFIQSIKS